MKDYVETFNEEWENPKDKNEIYPNIMVLGTCGAGKSSLINQVFNKEIAPVSDVEDETKKYTLYRGKNTGLSVNLIDSPGYKIGSCSEYMSELKKVLDEGVDGENIHIIWYCLSITKKRIEDMDVEILNELSKDKNIRERICLVFTKSDKDNRNQDNSKNLEMSVRNKLDYNYDFYRVSNNPKMPFDIVKLIEWSGNAIDNEDLRNKLIAAQLVDLDAKSKPVREAIAIAVAASAAVAAAPIPLFSDAALLVPIQVRLVKSIINIYGISNLVHISEAVVGDVVIASLGKSLAANLAKAIPVIGALAGGIANVVVASSMTCALGIIISEICYSSVKAYLNGEKVIWEDIFEDGFAERIVELAKEFFKSGDFAKNTAETIKTGKISDVFYDSMLTTASKTSKKRK